MQTLNGGRVLVAEDTAIQAKKLIFYLEKFGYEVKWAENGKDAADMLENGEFDLVITDVQMPVMDGIGLLQRVRSDPATEKIPVMVLTSQEEDSVCLQALNLEANDFLRKPFKPEEIQLRARNLIMLRRFENILMSENFELNKTLLEKNRLLETHFTELQKTHERLKQTQAQLVQTAKLASLGVMGGGIAHEINNPLSVISMCSEFIDESLQENAARMDTIKVMNGKIIDSTARIARIVNHMKIFARAGDVRMEVKSLDLAKSVDNVLDFFRELCRREGIDLQLDFGSEPLRVDGDPVAIEQVLLNILQNAVDAVKSVPTPRIQVAMSREGPLAIVRVSDNGAGIPEENFNRIYDPFFTTKEPGSGTGLGLSVAKAYVEECDGAIYFESRPGRTVFGLSFRLSKPGEERSHEREK